MQGTTVKKENLKIKPVWKSSNCCTNSQITPHTIK